MANEVSETVDKPIYEWTDSLSLNDQRRQLFQSKLRSDPYLRQADEEYQRQLEQWRKDKGTYNLLYLIFGPAFFVAMIAFLFGFMVYQNLVALVVAILSTSIAVVVLTKIHRYDKIYGALIGVSSEDLAKQMIMPFPLAMVYPPDPCRAVSNFLVCYDHQRQPIGLWDARMTRYHKIIHDVKVTKANHHGVNETYFTPQTPEIRKNFGGSFVIADEELQRRASLASQARIDRGFGRLRYLPGFEVNSSCVTAIAFTRDFLGRQGVVLASSGLTCENVQPLALRDLPKDNLVYDASGDLIGAVLDWDGNQHLYIVQRPELL